MQTYAGSRFALKHGFVSEHQEDHLLDLPVPKAGAPSDGRRGWPPRSASRGQTDFTFVSWSGRCPDDAFADYAHLRTMMNHDVPIGGVDFQPVTVDVDLIRRGEVRMVEQGYLSIVTAARHADGRLAAYSLMFVSHHLPTEVWQDDTYVLTAHRGHGLGAIMKAINLEIVQRDYRERQRVHTWTAESNGSMQRINETFGFRAVEKMHEFQRVDTT